MKFLNARVSVVATRRLYLRDVGVREGARDARATPVPDGAVPAPALAGSPVRTGLTAVDDHGHVRVVLVVLDHLVEKLVLELRRNHAVDHPASQCKQARGRRQMGDTTISRAGCATWRVWAAYAPSGRTRGIHH